MKKFIGYFGFTLLMSVGLLVGCGANSTPSNPPQATPTFTPIFTPTTTATPQPTQVTVNLNSDANFVVLAYSGINTTGATTLCGNLGLSPTGSMTGTAVMTCSGVQYINDAGGVAAQAQSDLTTAYNDALGRTIPVPVLVSGNLAGQTLYEGLYKCSGALAITSGTLTLDAQGNPNAVFIFQVATTLSTTSGGQVVLINSAKANNVFWQVGSSSSLGAGTSFMGTIMAHDQVTLNTGATLVGRALSENEPVTLVGNTITKPTP